jgi:thioredoxin reductase (NADPH)
LALPTLERLVGKGVFAVGDVRHNSVKKVASVVGGGAIAISSTHFYLAEEVA